MVSLALHAPSLIVQVLICHCTALLPHAQYLQIDCCRAGVDEQEHQEEKRVWRLKYAPAVQQHHSCCACTPMPDVSIFECSLQADVSVAGLNVSMPCIALTSTQC